MLSSIAAAPNAWAVGESTFKAPAVEDMKAKITLDQVSIGVEAFDTAEKANMAFGKLNPNHYEVLPVLVVVKNGRKTAIRVSPLEVMYVVPGMGKAEALRANEIMAVGSSPSAPNLGPRPLPIPIRKKKNPLSAPEIEGRAFAVKMIAAGEVASGFFYFNVKHRTTAKLYLNGLVDASTNREIFYFEIPFVD